MTEFSARHIGMANFAAGNGIDPILLSFVGLAVVFCGLVLIFVAIILLPRVLRAGGDAQTPDRHSGKKDAASGGHGPDAELLLAVAVAVHLERHAMAAKRAITWERPVKPGGGWQRFGRMWQMHERLNHEGRVKIRPPGFAGHQPRELQGTLRRQPRFLPGRQPFAKEMQKT